MTPVFADTSYYVAFLNPDDVFHVKAVALSRSFRRTVVVTEFVLVELGNYLSHVEDRRLFVDLLPMLRSNPHVVLVPASPDLFIRGCELYAHRPDKAWSMTDCISFVVMKEYGVREALTSDHHFEQAGFEVLLK